MKWKECGRKWLFLVSRYNPVICLEEWENHVHCQNTSILANTWMWYILDRHVLSLITGVQVRSHRIDMKSVVKFGLERDIIMLFCTHASEYVHNLICTRYHHHMVCFRLLSLKGRTNICRNLWVTWREWFLMWIAQTVNFMKKTSPWKRDLWRKQRSVTIWHAVFSQ